MYRKCSIKLISIYFISACATLLFFSFVSVGFLDLKTLLSRWLSLSFSIFNICRLLKNILHAFLYINVHFSTHIIILTSIFTCSLLCSFFGHFSFLFEITLVSHENFGNVRTGMLISSFDPFTNVVETSLIGDIVGNDHAISFFVERLSQSLKSLLACSVPYLDLYTNIFI